MAEGHNLDIWNGVNLRLDGLADEVGISLDVVIPLIVPSLAMP